MSERIITTILSGLLFVAAMTAGILAAMIFGEPKANLVNTYRASVAQPNIPVNASVNDFGVTNVMFKKKASNTVLYGALNNQSDRDWNKLIFEVQAFDKDHNMLLGVEDRVIFSVTQLKRGQSVSINDGYGVWLFGIPIENISRINLRLMCGDAAAGKSYFLSCKASNEAPKSLEYYRAIEE